MTTPEQKELAYLKARKLYKRIGTVGGAALGYKLGKSTLGRPFTGALVGGVVGNSIGGRIPKKDY